MASNSGFTDLLPSNTSSVALGDDDFRSTKSFMKNWWQQEHYALDGSAASAGVHKEGFARIYTQSAVPTAILPQGQLWHDPDDDSLRVATAAGTDSWVTLIDGSVGTTAPAREYLFFSEENVASSTSATASRFGTKAGFELSDDFGPQIRSGAITGISGTFGANITAGSLEINPTINRAPSIYSLTMDSSSVSRPSGIGGAGHDAKSTTGVSTLTFAAGDWIGCYVAGDGSLNPSGSGDLSEIVIELTYID